MGPVYHCHKPCPLMLHRQRKASFIRWLRPLQVEAVPILPLPLLLTLTWLRLLRYPTIPPFVPEEIRPLL